MEQRWSLQMLAWLNGVANLIGKKRIKNYTEPKWKKLRYL